MVIAVRHREFITLIGGAALAMLGLSVMAGTRSASQAAPTQVQVARQRMTFSSGDLAISGVLYRPQGRGPFPALIWNHGSEKTPGAGPQFDSVASIFVPAGYVVFAPVRRGHGYSKGRYIGVELIEGAALIGAVGLGSTRHFAKDLARGRAVCTEKALSDQRSDLWRYTGGAQGRTAM
jgi:hypothetical protein